MASPSPTKASSRTCCGATSRTTTAYGYIRGSAMLHQSTMRRGRSEPTACLQNRGKIRRPTDGLRTHFDVFVESAVVGLRKPDPRIYELVCRELGVAPSRVAFLDDIGRNLKPARELGMTTIKVEDPDQALRELSALLEFDLID